MEMATKKGIWNIFGTNLTPADAHYEVIKNAIEADTVNQSFLQKETGHCAPILVNRLVRSIQFCPW